MAIVGQVSKVDAGKNLDAEIGSDASNLNRGTVLGLRAVMVGQKEGEVFSVVMGKTSFENIRYLFCFNCVE